uniref:Uncharacterized protein n=1 Tax=Molossus molossus TaxID=27622 RepID=A0A7J8EEM0_MOLMO|nr:hypothetical protein HJG59_008831 [Molossus molossus]
MADDGYLASITASANPFNKKALQIHGRAKVDLQWNTPNPCNSLKFVIIISMLRKLNFSEKTCLTRYKSNPAKFQLKTEGEVSAFTDSISSLSETPGGCLPLQIIPSPEHTECRIRNSRGSLCKNTMKIIFHNKSTSVFRLDNQQAEKSCFTKICCWKWKKKAQHSLRQNRI